MGEPQACETHILLIDPVPRASARWTREHRKGVVHEGRGDMVHERTVEREHLLLQIVVPRSRDVTEVLRHLIGEDVGGVQEGTAQGAGEVVHDR
jgi:hypothetical protein